MKVLVTGAGGFIGSHLADSLLGQGHDVCGLDLHLDLLAHNLSKPKFLAVQGDVSDENLLRKLVDGVDVVYHLASAHLDVSLSDEHYRRVNVGATLSLLEVSRQASVKRFVHCSSVGVIGDVKNPPANETTDCHPTNIYEKTKLEGEETALGYYRNTGFPVVVMRPAWVYGPRCPRTAKLIRTISKGRFPFFGAGDNMRHPVYISDAVLGLELCASAERGIGEVFIIAGESPVRVYELIQIISDELGVKAPKLRLPISWGLAAGYGLELGFKLIGKSPPFSRRSLDFFLKDNAYDIEKAKRVLGYQPQIDLRTGIQKTIQSNRIMKETK